MIKVKRCQQPVQFDMSYTTNFKHISTNKYTRAYIE